MESLLFKIAQFIRHRPNRLSCAVRVSEARNVLGDAYTAAIAGGFLLPNHDDGELYVTQDAGKQAILQAVYEDETLLLPGDEIMVAQYAAVVAENNGDGTYQVQFGAVSGRPSGENRLATQKRSAIKLANRPKTPSTVRAKKHRVFWDAGNDPDNDTFDWGN